MWPAVPRYKHHDFAVAVIGTQPFPDVDSTLSEKFVRFNVANLVDTKRLDYADVEAASRTVPILTIRFEIDDASVVLHGHQSDRRQGANDAIFCATQAFKVNPMLPCKLSRLGLRH